MPIGYDDLNSAMKDVEETMRRVDLKADQMARILKTRLRNVRPHNLRALKRDLKNFNSNTGEWK